MLEAAAASCNNGSSLPIETRTKPRLFVGVFPPEPVLAQLRPLLEAWRAALPDPRLRWAPVENLHVTLCFLGGVDADRVEDLATALSSKLAGMPRTEVRLKGLGAFPGHQRPKVLWAGIEGGLGTLQDLQEASRSVCGPFLAKPDPKPFSPHLTLARIKNGDGKLSHAVRRLALAEANMEIGPWPIDQVHLVNSVTGADRSRYESIAEFALGR
jgi:RNA 2',3'-cyclic 3'-phosphodiesterase